ncbi:hypothetical protein [Asanoa iriomotensis]|uniref:Uncharacterized protein n=1 Tax=Asanoa iriomotensis TaxID=234613 RepID=A0ABQ4C3H0_9ACTN|nr:hypothetical protein [Asanoa iriomotensis]GIF57314.1 hypothetical protein Air01nite_34090 [Asanoa iriomotensis]
MDRLKVDGSEVIPSAVAVQPGGTVLTGEAGWRQPNGGGGFVADPLRPGRDRAAVAGAEVAVME